MKLVKWNLSIEICQLKFVEWHFFSVVKKVKVVTVVTLVTVVAVVAEVTVVSSKKNKTIFPQKKSTQPLIRKSWK